MNAPSPRIVNVVWTDDGDPTFYEWEIEHAAGIKLNSIVSSSGSDPVTSHQRRYYGSGRLHSLLATVDPDEVDVVLVANNLGVGVQYVSRMSDELKAKVVVISNDPLSDADQNDYRYYGVDQFCARDALPQLFKERYGLANEG